MPIIFTKQQILLHQFHASSIKIVHKAAGLLRPSSVPPPSLLRPSSVPGPSLLRPPGLRSGRGEQCYRGQPA